MHFTPISNSSQIPSVQAKAARNGPGAQPAYTELVGKAQPAQA